jgi:methyl-accepting chemotaxis protein
MESAMRSFFTLRSKNMSAFLLIACITAIVGVTGVMGMEKMKNKFQLVTESAPLIQTAVNMKLMVNRDLMVVMKLMAALDTDELAVTWKEHEAIAKRFEQLKKAVLDGEVNESVTIFPAKDQKLRDIVTASGEYHSKNFMPSFKVIFDQVNKKLSAESYDYDLLDTIDETTINIGKQLEEELNKVIEIAQAVIVQAEKEAHETKAMSGQITLIATVLGIVAAVILGFVFSGIVTRPVIQAVEYTRIVSDGDFTKSLDIIRKDEIGTMANAINKMVASLATIFRDITSGVVTLTLTASELSEISGELKIHAKEMSDKSDAVSRASDKMNQRLSSVAALSEESSSNLDTVSAAMEEMNVTVNEIAKNTNEARSITGTAVKKAKQTSERVNELGTDAKEIGKVTDVIGEISEQTNLLALNATIEAARAGEAGKGFAVVANEIKQLANQTADAAKNIKLKINRIQNSTDGTVVEIEEISKVIHDVDSIVSSIAGAVEEQSVTAKEIARNIAQAADGIHETNAHISESSIASATIAEDISSVNENSTRVADSSRKVTDNVSKLTAFALQLKQVLANFKV